MALVIYGQQGKNRGAGFTLIELMVAVVVVAVLAALLLSAVGGMRSRSEDVTCVSNLHQIGLAMLAYTSDHDGKLPGPLLIGQFAYNGSYPYLSSLLQDYVAVTASKTKIIRNEFRRDVFVCPANRRELGKYFGYSPLYGMNAFVRMKDEAETVAPFGYANPYNRSLFGVSGDTPPIPGHRLADIVDEKGAPAMTSTWAMMDLDQKCEFSTYQTAVKYDILPEQPVHGSHRNALFFDFHVGRLPLTRNVVVPAVR